MRRVILCVLCIFLLTTAVFAAGSVSDLQNTTAFASDGTCEVTLTVQMNLDEVPSQLYFPVPLHARNVQLNGESARMRLGSNVRNVDLGNLIRTPGNYSFIIHYSLADQITADNAERLWLEMELLSGFAYPISNMKITITIPGEVESRPVFSSTYHQEDVESLLDVQTVGGNLTVKLKRGLNDHEKLTMRLQVSQEQFPQPIAKRWSLGTEDVIMYALLVAAVLYWLLLLRFWPSRAAVRSTEPEGISAGELGSCLTGSGGDLTMMVLSWAQLGYLRIQLDENGRVLLHKRMEMGNERSGYENKYFRALFAKRRTVDTSTRFFASAWESASHKTPRRSVYRKGSGNPYIFRAIVALAGMMGGYSLAASFVDDTVWLTLLRIGLCVLTAVLSWLIQGGAYVVFLRDKTALLIALGCSVAWIVLGNAAGQIGMTIFCVVMQWLGGFAAAYGGLRSEPGAHVFRDIIGLRRFLRSVNSEKLAKIVHRNPDYYYRMVPYAYALGLDGKFARKMGSLRLPECPYLHYPRGGHLTAAEWNRILRETVSSMDAGHKRQRMERLIGKR